MRSSSRGAPQRTRVRPSYNMHARKARPPPPYPLALLRLTARPFPAAERFSVTNRFFGLRFYACRKAFGKLLRRVSGARRLPPSVFWGARSDRNGADAVYSGWTRRGGWGGRESDMPGPRLFFSRGLRSTGRTFSAVFTVTSYLYTTCALSLRSDKFREWSR